MSTACTAGCVLAVWMPGLPRTTLDLITLSRVPPAMSIPFVFPETVFSSIRFPLAVPMSPMPKSSAGSEYPLPCAAFSRPRLLWPITHMPPHNRPGALEPLRVATLPSTSVPNDEASTRMPDMQLVDTVRFSMRASLVRRR
jgi:hypothetical protein